jgi:TRAP-type C4-dicarboxylate transport system permease small subunit
MELLFTSKHYKRIVGVFSWACIIFLSIFFVISFLKLFLDKIIEDYILDLIILTFIILSATIFRCLLILHSIIKIQIKSNINE